MDQKRPKVVAIHGFSSNVGKTTLVCELLRRLPGWEAIKVTRGHTHSVGTDPADCCLSDPDDEPIVHSGREANYQAGKDTGCFWDAGASNVHWVIVKDHQIELGINKALGRVQSDAVLIEGNSFLDYLTPDLVVMCARSGGGKVKLSARSALKRSDVLYISSLNSDGRAARNEFKDWQSSFANDLDFDGCQIFTHDDIPLLISLISRQHDALRPQPMTGRVDMRL